METKKIAVIGGGISGLAATQRLFYYGFKNVLLLEGSNRLGGRIHTIKHDNGVLEMGAQWIHGEKGNPVFNLAQSHSLLFSPPINKQAIEDESWYEFYSPDGHCIPEEIVDETLEIIENLFKEAETFIDKGGVILHNSPKHNGGFNKKPLKKDGFKKRARRRISENLSDEIKILKSELSKNRTSIGRSRSVSWNVENSEEEWDDEEQEEEESMGSFLRSMFLLHLDRTNPPNKIRCWKEALFDWRMKFEKTENACPTMDDVSFAAWNDYVLPPGDGDVELGRKGYAGVLDTIISEIPSTAIRLNTHIDKIKWKNMEGDVKIFSGNEVISVDHVILTSSLGFLKKHTQFFEPTLPFDKQNAIERLGFGTVDKIFLLFDEPFWKNSCDGIQFLWTTDAKASLKSDTSDSEKAWYKGIHGFDTIWQHDNILEGWLAGSEAEECEISIDDINCLNICHELLLKFTKNEEIPKPKRIIRSSWFLDKYACGSYSYRRIGSSALDCKKLAFPLPSRAQPSLMFAGEATHVAFYSTTHGAYLSGQREANRLYQLYSSNSK